MSEQDTGGYRCNVCGMIFNSLGDLDAHTREKLEKWRDEGVNNWRLNYEASIIIIN
jgi:hypothetical protein